MIKKKKCQYCAILQSGFQKQLTVIIKRDELEKRMIPIKILLFLYEATIRTKESIARLKEGIESEMQSELISLHIRQVLR